MLGYEEYNKWPFTIHEVIKLEMVKQIPSSLSHKKVSPSRGIVPKRWPHDGAI